MVANIAEGFPVCNDRACHSEGAVGSQKLHPAPQYAGGNVTVWRWLMLIGLLVPCYWIGEGLAQLIEAVIEWNFFENRRVLYYFIGTTVGCCPLFALMRSCHCACYKYSQLLDMPERTVHAQGQKTGPRQWEAVQLLGAELLARNRETFTLGQLLARMVTMAYSCSEACFLNPQRPLARMFQTAFLPVLWACIFRGQRHASHAWQEVYKWTLRVCCKCA